MFQALRLFPVLLTVTGTLLFPPDAVSAESSGRTADRPVKVVGIQRLDDTAGKTGKDGSGDNWHMTWAENDKQYASLCDGIGFSGVPGDTGEYKNTRVYAITGQPPNHRFEYLPGYPDLFGPTMRFYGFGIIALDGSIYNFASTPRERFTATPWTAFVGAKLTYSPDNGKTWKNQDGTPLRWEDWQERNRENMVFWEEDGGAFSLLTVLQMGKNYRQNRDGYVYVYAPNGNAEGTMNQLVMFRVPKDKVLDRSAYEHFVSRNPDGTANWSPDMAERGLVHTFPSGWVNSKTVCPYAWHPSVVYVKPLGQYLMANWGMGTDETGQWFRKPSYLGFWTAPKPWGPWTQVHEETAWVVHGDTKNRNYQPQISPKWIAPDGRSFWLVWTNFHGGYTFNWQKVLIRVEEDMP